ncbi:MAG: isoprenylcysteine carboxylmethyltransferase family protein [bacterium]|nr:isoprenylcysteine carboxylmethyltransferase family protein [bacterium]
MLYLLSPELFPHPFFAALFTVASLGIVAVELRIFLKKSIPGAEHKDKSSLFVVLGGVAAFIFLLWYFSYARIGIIHSALASYIGFGMLFSGFFIRQWAIQTLDDYFTPIVSLQYDHVLIDGGPYRFVRHPAYTGLMLELAGAALAARNGAALAAVFVCVVPSLLYRVWVEEKALREKFEDAYRSYQRKTKRFIPYIL